MQNAEIFLGGGLFQSHSVFAFLFHPHSVSSFVYFIHTLYLVFVSITHCMVLLLHVLFTHTVLWFFTRCIMLMASFTYCMVCCLYTVGFVCDFSIVFCLILYWCSRLGILLYYTILVFLYTVSSYLPPLVSRD